MTAFPLMELGGEGQVLHLALANGFPPQTYLPLLRPLLNDYRALCLPPRALWPDEPVPTALRDWESLADDLLEGLAQHDLSSVIGVGHSFGAVASILACLREPSRFSALVLLDPTILPEEALHAFEDFRASGGVSEFPLVRGALRRTRHFPDRQAAATYWRSRTLFQNWPEESFQLYVEHGTRPAVAGGVELVWPPEWEAYYFSTLYTHVWDRLPELAALAIPVLTLRGGDSDTFYPDAAARFQSILPRATLIEIPGHGHLFPQTAPAEASSIIRDWLRIQSL